jgi:hypothetical protein
VWLWGRASVHVGISGVTVGLMTFLFLIGLLRRDRLGVAIALLVFFLYGGMVMSVLPREPHVSFEYHFFGAVAGVIAAIVLRRFDPLPPRKRYSWEDDEDEAVPTEDELEPPRPGDVPVLWEGPRRQVGGDDVVVPFRTRDGETLH